MYGLLLVYSKLPRMVQITLMSFAVLKSYSIVPKQPLVVFMCCETLGFEFSNFSKSLRVLEKTMESQ
jgi:predicted transcriptional regulator